MYHLVFLALFSAGDPALAADPSLWDVSLEDVPNLVDVFRRQRPIMGQCPMGEREDSVPSASHLLHIGTTGFYLDYAKRLGLTSKQRSALETIRDTALKAGAERSAAAAVTEEELWRLTGSGAGSERDTLEAKVRAISVLRADQRWIYLSAVAEAADVLSADQQHLLAGR